MSLDEKTLINQCIKGNRIAQKTLYDTYGDLLYGISLRYAKDREVAQDIFQDSFVKIFSKLHTFQHKGSFEGWLRKIVSNTAIEYFRKKKDIFSFDEKSISQDYSVEFEKNLEEEELLKIIQSLPNGYRMIFNMYAIEGYSHKEIAEKLNISEGTSKSQLARARKVIQNQLEKLNTILIQPNDPKTRLL